MLATMRFRKTYRRVWAGLASVILLVSGSPVTGQQTGELKLFGGGSYKALAPEQQGLVKKWFEEYQKITGRQIDAQTGYDNASLSTRSTFEAVTHALLHTQLTDKTSGASLGNGLSLVRLVESVHGRIAETRGDQQFRVYVMLEGDALKRLYASREFKRTRDNSVFHIGYPINFRQQAGTPSLQISVTRSGYRADIDVDYRSSSGPQALVNGHLTAANSDVRAGNNYFRHIGRWDGLSNWWGKLFGVTQKVRPAELAALDSEYAPPRVKANQPVEEAVHDFFQTWLVEQKPETALSYMSVKALPCIAEFANGESAQSTMVRLRIYQQMKGTTQRVGKVSGLEQALRGVARYAPDARPVVQPYGKLLIVEHLPNDLAREIDCRIALRMKLALDLPKANRDFGSFYGVLTHLQDKSPEGKPVDRLLYQLWTQDEGAWKLVTWRLEYPFEASVNPAKRATEAPEVDVKPGDPLMLRTLRNFLTDWLVDNKYELAAGFFAREALACGALAAGDRHATTTQRQSADLRGWLSDVGKAAGPVKSLNEAIERAEIGHPEAVEVSQAHEKEYAVAHISDGLAAMETCDARNADSAIAEGDATLAVSFAGNVFKVSFDLRKSHNQGGVVTLNWAQRAGAWKIVAFDAVTH